MSDFIERARALDAAATAGPWEVGEEEQWDLDGDRVPQKPVMARGRPLTWDDHGGEVFEPYDAEFIAAARSMPPAAADALARVRGLHRKFGLYELEDSCTNTSEEHRQERHHEASDEAGEYYCEDMPIGAACDECRNEDGERLDWPCATYEATKVEG